MLFHSNNGWKKAHQFYVTRTVHCLSCLRSTDFLAACNFWCQLKVGRSSCLPEDIKGKKVKGKGKVHPKTSHEGPEWEKRYISTFSLTSALDGGGWSTPRPQGRSGQVRKNSPPPGFDPRTVQPIASLYIDWAIPDLFLKTYGILFHYMHSNHYPHLLLHILFF